MVNTQSCLCQGSCEGGPSQCRECCSDQRNVEGPFPVVCYTVSLDPGFTDVKRKKLWSNKFRESGFLTAELAEPFILNVPRASWRGEWVSSCLPNLFEWVEKKEMKRLQISHPYKWGNWVLNRLKYFHRVMQVRAGLEDEFKFPVFSIHFTVLLGFFLFPFMRLKKASLWIDAMVCVNVCVCLFFKLEFVLQFVVLVLVLLRPSL